MAGWHHENAKWKPKVCAVCSTTFIPKSGSNKFCSDTCRGKWKYVSGKVTTESQYREINGNWERYASRLLAGSRRKHKGLTREDILAVLKTQEYKCALSGEPLTCILSKGIKIQTNASIDRVEAGGVYTRNNIQIVCAAVNSFRRELSVDDFVTWCKKVAMYRS